MNYMVIFYDLLCFSELSFSSVHDSIVDYLNKKASLEYLQLVKQARAGNSEISSQSNEVQPTSET